MLRFVGQHFSSPVYRARYVLDRIFVAKDQITPDRIRRYAFFWDMEESQYSFTAAAKQIVPENPERLIKQFRTIDVPTLIVWGEADPVIPLAYARRFHEDIRQSRLSVIADTGHVPHEERPERTLAVLRDFIEQFR